MCICMIIYNLYFKIYFTCRDIQTAVIETCAYTNRYALKCAFGEEYKMNCKSGTICSPPSSYILYQQ